MKLVLVACSLLPTDDRYKRFMKLIQRSSDKFFEVYPGLWVLKTKARPAEIARRLDALLDDDDTPREEGEASAPINDRLFLCTIFNDHDHRGGWVSREFWNWLNEPN